MSKQYRGHMPSLSTIVDWWVDHWEGEMTKGYWDEPFCFRCGWVPPFDPFTGDPWKVGGWLERAHLKDWALGGSNSPDNLVPLCPTCHKAMPSFGSSIDALVWIDEAGPKINTRTSMFSWLTKCIFHEGSHPYIGWNDFYRWRHAFEEWWERVQNEKTRDLHEVRELLDQFPAPLPHGWKWTGEVWPWLR